MLLAAQNQTAIELVSLVFLVAGFGLCGALWYVMVVRGGREERRLAAEKAADAEAVAGPEA